MRLLLLLLLAAFSAAAQNALPPIGSWREHLPYGSTIDVTASPNRVYAATPYSLFSVDFATKEIERRSKISGLSEVGISTIQFDLPTNKLFIAYANSNIDVLASDGIHNIPGLKRENITGDKAIYHFYPSGELCYVSTGLGVIVLNTTRYEIRETWLIGQNGGYVKTNMFTRDNAYYYAATEEGLKCTPVTNPNPADFRTWQTVMVTGGTPPAKGVVNLAGRIVVQQNDSLFVQSGSGWSLFFANGWSIVSINESEGKLMVCQMTAAGAAQVVVLNGDGTTARVLQQPGVINFPRKAIARGADYWVADQYRALSHWFGGTNELYRLNSPEDIATGQLLVYNKVFYAAAGSINESWNYLYNRSGVYQFKEGNWTNYNGFNYPQLEPMLDFITVAVDPRDETLWAGSFGGGLLHVKADNSFEIFKDNSPIGPTIGDPTSYRVSGLAFDADNNLWVANFGAARYLHVRKANGDWSSFTAPFSLPANEVGQILIDDAAQVWVVSPKGNGLLVLNHGGTLDNPADDKWKFFRGGSGNGNLPSSDVLSIAKDRNGYIWVGTSDGVGVIQCASEVFTTPCEAILPIAEQGGFANYLFKGEAVQAIAVDGADRKWVGTRNGVWLVSPDGDKLLAHFNENNSPLFSNDVRSIAVDGATGEVYLGTARGIMSFRGTATEPGVNNDNLLVYPNPVPPNYAGTIAIRGLAENSFVKITELNGRLVYQTKALGGQAVWNGLDYTGKRIASGIYLVLVIDEQRRERAAGKIVFISR